MSEPIWQPSFDRASESLLAQFMRNARVGAGGGGFDYDELWRYSVSEPESFWRLVWDFCGVTGEPGNRVLQRGKHIREARFFPDGRVNYAENLLRKHGDEDAVIFRGEDRSRRSWSWNQLRGAVAAIRSGLISEGIQAGDHVGGIVANTPESAAAMIATASLGAVWSSCSPDFGVSGVLDRFDQISPKILFCMDGYHYNGRWHETLGKAARVSAAIASVRRTVVLPYSGADNGGSLPPGAAWLGEFAANRPGSEPGFDRVGFNAPLFIMFSSGTTGLPKCMVHGTGGSLIQHLKEHRLHCDIRPGDRVMFFTTCGWMMWNWLISALASQASLVLYDGSPLHPDGGRLAEIVESERVTHFGASAKYFDACAKAGVSPAVSHGFPRLRTILSTGSPLSPESFRYIYRDWKSDVCLSSISGGTDILGCFTGGCPTAPVFAGECQKRLLGMDVQIYGEEGHPVQGAAGELVCASPHPSMPTEFFNDPGGEKYRRAYFDRFPGVWTHGDWAELTVSEGVIFYGRSDATLNVGGVRIGTSEIYRPVEKIQDVLEALVIEHGSGSDTELVLFVRLRDGKELSGSLRDEICAEIRARASPRHVPAKVIAVPDIPRTKSGKIVELAVRSVVHGQQVKNVSALANPEALDHFREIPELSGRSS